MRFTIIGHACLYIDTGAQRILVDPWLSGSCYWRSWWHFPPNTPIRPEHLNPDCVYLSHHHFDHFHYPSLRRISKRARVFIPRFAVDVMRSELQQIGFADVVELPHGEPVTLDGGTRLASFQYGPDDSALVVARDDVVLTDLNDCKIKGPAAAPMLEIFGSPTFLFKSHSFAQAYPHCYEIADPADARLITREDFLETFLDAIRELRPRYAVPFASMVAFLHPESRACNAFSVRPPEVAEAVAASEVAATTRTVLMVPGDSWDSAGGFDLRENDYYEKEAEWIERLAVEREASIRRTEEDERDVALEFEPFARYFTAFLRALPWLVWLAIRRSVVFFVPSSAEPYWVLDFKRRKVRRTVQPPAQRADVIHLREAILADAIAKRVVAFSHISMRIRVELAPGGVQTDFLFWGLLTLYELGYFPVLRLATPRAVGVLWRRRAEVWSFARSMLALRSLDQRIFGSLMSRRQQS